MSVSVSEDEVSRAMTSLLEASARDQEEMAAMSGLMTEQDIAAGLLARSVTTLRNLGMAESDDAGAVLLTPFGRAVLSHPRAQAISAAMNETNVGRA